MRAYVRAYVRVCVCAYMHACVRACVCTIRVSLVRIWDESAVIRTGIRSIRNSVVVVVVVTIIPDAVVIGVHLRAVGDFGTVVPRVLETVPISTHTLSSTFETLLLCFAKFRSS